MREILVKVETEKKGEASFMHSNTGQSLDEKFALDVSHRFSEESAE
jgi:hypothetical protein